MKELLSEFKSESLDLCRRMMEILEKCEDNTNDGALLEEYGLLADRMMGGSKLYLVNVGDEAGRMKVIAAYTEIQKLLGYKAAKLEPSSGLLPVVVGFLQDSTQLLTEVVNSLGTNDTSASNKLLASTLLDRLEWVNGQFDSSISGSVPLTHKQLDKRQITNLIEALKKVRVH